MKRVVITGLGVVSCLGNNQSEIFESLINSKSGITFSEEYKEYNLKSNVHGKPKIDLEDHVDRKFIRFMGPGSAYNFISMSEAVKDSGLEDKEVSNEYTGMIMGSGGPSIENVILAADKTRAKTPKLMGPFIVPRTMASTASATLAVPFILNGTASVAEAVLPIVLGTMKGPINFGVFALVLSAARITFSIEGPPEPIIIPVLKLLTSLSSNPESLIASFIAI